MNLLIEWLIWRWVVLPRFRNWQLAGPVLFDSIICTLNQGSSTPRPQTTTSPWPSRNLATQQEVSGRPVHLYPYLEVLPIACVTNWAPPTVRSVGTLDSYRNTNPSVNCKCKGSRLHAPYENLMPDDLILRYGELYNYFTIYDPLPMIIL